MREPMLREGFQRLERIQGREVSFDAEVSGTTHTIEATLGEIFRTDLAQALLLDTHVNVPAAIWTSDAEDNLAVGAAATVFEDNGLTIPSIMSQEHDLQLISALMEARIGQMTAPVTRAIGVLKYTDNDVVEDLARADNEEPIFEGVESYFARSFDWETEAARQTWNDIQAFDRKVLSLQQR